MSRCWRVFLILLLSGPAAGCLPAASTGVPLSTATPFEVRDLTPTPLPPAFYTQLALTPSPTIPPFVTETPTTVKTTELRVFSYWNSGVYQAGLDELLGRFRVRHPEVDISNMVCGDCGFVDQVLRNLMLQHNPPDTLQAQIGRKLVDEWVVSGYMQPLDDVYQENGLSEVFPKGLLEIVSYDGHPWSVPLQVYRTNVLWYNTALFEKAGIRKAPETWDEFLADAKLLKEQGIVPLALAGDWTVGVLFESLLVGNLGPDRYQGLWSGTTAWDDPGVTAALEQFRSILVYVNADHAGLTWDETDIDMLKDGQAAMTVLGSWAEGRYKDAGFTDYGWAPVPGTRGIYIVTADGFALPRETKQPDLVKDFLRIVGSREGQEVFVRRLADGSICSRMDCDYTEASPYQQSSAADWRSDTIVPSPVAGAAISETWEQAFIKAIQEFAITQDVSVTQAALSQACIDTGGCK